MRYIVGYAPNERGSDAIALASTLAHTQGAELLIVHVLDGPAPDRATSREERTAQSLRDGSARQWLNEALAGVAQGVPATTQVAYADSAAEGLLDLAKDSDVELIVVSAARFGPLRRFTIGSVANALLHSSYVPVALVPSGYERRPGITRMTAAIGSRAGARTLLEVAERSAARQRVPLRLLSLIALDYEPSDGRERAAERAREHATDVLDEALGSVGDRTQVTATVATGASIEEAVESVTWDDGEIMLIGSSRLAENRKIFMGATANKILRELPIPLVVVPRTVS